MVETSCQIKRLTLIVRVNVVLNRTVVVDSVDIVTWIWSFELVPVSLSSAEASLGSFSNGDGDGNENVKTTNRLIQQNNNFARGSRFFVHCFAVTARLRRENA